MCLVCKMGKKFKYKKKKKNYSEWFHSGPEKLELPELSSIWILASSSRCFSWGTCDGQETRKKSIGRRAGRIEFK